MKFTHTYIFIFLFSFLITPAISFSQSISTSDYNSFSLGIKGGFQTFYGDVMQVRSTADNKYKKANTCGALELSKNFNQIFGVRVSAMMGRLSGASSNLNLHFETKSKQYSCQGFVNMNNLLTIYPKKEKKINVYMFGGIGVIDFRSRIYTYDENALITSVGWDSAGTSKTSARKEFVFPFGIGLRLKADSRFDFGLEFNMQLTNTDKLDAWELNKSYMDRYSNVTASFIFKIGGKKEYVDWVNPFMDTTKTAVTTAQNNTTPVNTNTAKTNIADNTVKANNVDNTTTENITKTNTTVTTTPVNKFYITDGSFNSRKPANEKAGKLKKIGYDGAEALEANNGSWLAVYKSFANLDDAKNELETIRISNADAKLFERKDEKNYSEIVIAAAMVADTNKVAVKTNTSTTNTTVANTNQTQTSTTITNKSVQVKDTSTTSKTAKTNTNTVTNTNPVNTNSTTANTSDSNKTNQTTTTTTTTVAIVKKFFIIAGSFPTEQMANTEVASLISKGYPDAIVVGKNDSGNWRIAFKGYAAREDATKDLAAIKAKNPSAWIFEKK